MRVQVCDRRPWNGKPATGQSAASTQDQYLGTFCTTGFIVLHRNRVVFEKYLQGVQPQDVLLSASMSKTILSLLVGVAVAEGKLALDERIGNVLTDFEGSAFAQDSIEDLLRMTSRAALKTSSSTPSPRSSSSTPATALTRPSTATSISSRCATPS